MSLKRHIPNTLTSLNLLSGCFAIYFAFLQQFDFVAYAVFMAAIFDFFDGFSARLFKVSSPIGKESQQKVSSGVLRHSSLHQRKMGFFLHTF